MTSTHRETQRQYWAHQKNRKHPSDSIVEAFVQPKLDFIRIVVSLPRIFSVLDVGCGNGYFTYYLSKWGTTIGLDFSKSMLSQNPSSGYLAQGSAYDLPFSDDSFDMVLCSNLLHHLDEPRKAIAEMKRVSKRYVVLSEPNRYNPAIFALGLLKNEERNSLKYTEGYLSTMTLSQGLKLIACQAMGFVTPNRMPKWLVAVLSRIKGRNLY